MTIAHAFSKVRNLSSRAENSGFPEHLAHMEEEI